MLSLTNSPYHFSQCNQLPGRHTRTYSQPAQQLPSDFNFDFSSSAPLSILDNINSLANGVLPNDGMQSDSWGNIPRYTSEKLGRYSHQRGSSLSSLGSTGPASPYSSNTSNPQIAVTDSLGDDLSDMYAQHDNNSQGGSFYHQMAKPVSHYSGYQTFDPSVPEMAYPVTIPGPGGKQTRVDRSNLLPAPELSNSGSRSQPGSVASSIAGGDSPATPTVSHEDAAADRRRKGMKNSPAEGLEISDSPLLPILEGYGNMPKLDRTMTDVYGDELYSPNFAITSTPPQQHQMSAMSPPNELFSQRLNAANSQHLHITHSPNSTASHGRSSPFRHDSPYAPSSHDFNAAQNQGMQMNVAQRKQQQDVQMYQQQMARARTQSATPKTISPKDAMLEFNDDAEATFPLFPQPTGLEIDQMAKQMVPQGVNSHFMHSGHNGDQLSYLQPQMPSGMGIQVPQQYPFVARAQPVTTSSPPRLGSSGSSINSRSSTPSRMARPMGMAAEGGTYTCTYHGCTLRFETPALLQKHKREGHRQSHGLTVPRPHEGMTSSLLNSQAGPHRCDRINPSTGKPCNTIFSRPYDLTRHEDTIHNARKQKVRCDVCTEEKTFSRADALTRHYRVCHPDMDLPGKHRRRGGS
ncbi:unnamed protein product [Clonostachys rhizophaga]|uniref:C2H2-type domain-containing protein n=1 Tax=Clonostachys rhizophaga TaxID=160324 RepID=A0A9N9V1M6_9HYPO|nr:unnamed protein product [Clonostachys rhizophaga]